MLCRLAAHSEQLSSVSLKLVDNLRITLYSVWLCGHTDSIAVTNADNQSVSARCLIAVYERRS